MKILSMCVEIYSKYLKYTLSKTLVLSIYVLISFLHFIHNSYPHKHRGTKSSVSIWTTAPQRDWLTTTQKILLILSTQVSREISISIVGYLLRCFKSSYRDTSFLKLRDAQAII